MPLSLFNIVKHLARDRTVLDQRTQFLCPDIGMEGSTAINNIVDNPHRRCLPCPDLSVLFIPSSHLVTVAQCRVEGPAIARPRPSDLFTPIR